MNISVVCSDPRHPVYPWLEDWTRRQSPTHDARLARRVSELDGGDLLFLVSCSEIVRRETRRRFRACLVIHASDLPRGRGWSPHVWRVLEGADEIVVTLLEAADRVDSGPIWAQERLELAGHELHDEINAKLFASELRLMDLAVARFGEIEPRPQSEDGATYYRKRTPEDSRLDPRRSIAEQFDLLRVCDPVRYPAFFDWRGHRYKVTLEKLGPAEPGAGDDD